MEARKFDVFALSILLSVFQTWVHGFNVQDVCKENISPARPDSCFQFRAIIHCQYYCVDVETNEFVWSSLKILCNTATGQWMNNTSELCKDIRKQSLATFLSSRNHHLTTTSRPPTEYDGPSRLTSSKAWISIPVVMTFIAVGFIFIFIYIRRSSKRDRNQGMDTSSQTSGTDNYPEVYAPTDDVPVYVIMDPDFTPNAIQLPSYEAAIQSHENSPPPYTVKLSSSTENAVT